VVLVVFPVEILADFGFCVMDVTVISNGIVALKAFIRLVKMWALIGNKEISLILCQSMSPCILL